MVSLLNNETAGCETDEKLVPKDDLLPLDNDIMVGYVKGKSTS